MALVESFYKVLRLWGGKGCRMSFWEHLSCCRIVTKLSRKRRRYLHLVSAMKLQVTDAKDQLDKITCGSSGGALQNSFLIRMRGSQERFRPQKVPTVGYGIHQWSAKTLWEFLSFHLILFRPTAVLLDLSISSLLARTPWGIPRYSSMSYLYLLFHKVSLQDAMDQGYW